MERLDTTSVRALELRAPGACEEDARALYGRVSCGEILSSFSNEERQVIWSKICSATVDNLVPSLYGFFEDLKHLKVVADSVKRLLHLESKETVRSALEFGYSEADQDSDICLIQAGNSALASVPGNGADHFDVAYRALWLWAFREYQDLPAQSKRKLAGPQTGHADEAVLFEFASVAHKLGFRSEQIEQLLQQDPDREIARRLLTTARKADRFKFNDLESCVTEVTRLIRTAEVIQHDSVVDEDEIEEVVDDMALPPARCGVPNLLDQKRDKPLIFLDKLHSPIASGPNLSSAFI